MNMREHPEEEVARKMRYLREDLEVIKAREMRLEAERQLLVLKLIAAREQLLSHREQDE